MIEEFLKQKGINLVDLAVKEFGLTDDFREAGYVLPDGRLLDMSGKREGGTPFMRQVDHREIGRVFHKIPSISKPLTETRDDGTDKMIIFERQGNIRFHFTSGREPDVNISMETEQKPTEAQIRALRRSVGVCRRIGPNLCNIAYDVYFKNGQRCDEGYIENATSDDVGKVLAALEGCKKRERKECPSGIISIPNI